MIAELASSAPVQTGDNEPRHALYVGGEPIEGEAKNIVASYTEEGGGSELTFETTRLLENRRGANVTLMLGYGRDSRNLAPWWSGRLRRGGKESAFAKPARALGPFASMDREFRQQVDYRGFLIGSALYDITKYQRTGFPSGTVEVRGGGSYRIGQSEEAIFVEEVTLAEAANALMASADFTASDMPGRFGSRMFLPRPRPGATGKAKAVYGPGDYGPNGFRVTDKHEGPYAAVIVFRRNQDGSYAVRQSAQVPDFAGQGDGAPGRAYYIPEFVGDAAQAKQLAYDTARAIGAGEFSFELDLLSINPGLAKFDQISVWREDERAGGTWRETYQCLIDGGISASVSDWTMQCSGDAILVSEERVAAPRVVLPGVSAGVVGIPAPPRVVPPFESWGQDDVFFFEMAETYEELS